MKKIITVTVFDKEQYNGEWPPEDAAGAIAWLSEKVGSIPEAFRSTAKIEFNSVGGYEGSHCAQIEITYTRPETDEEESDRIQAEETRLQRQRASEMDTLARLQAKYGKGE